MTRTVLSAPTTFYVSPTGNDANDGLTPSTAKWSLQATWDMLLNSYDLGGRAVTLKLADGSYSNNGALYAHCALPGQAGANVYVEGNLSNPAAVYLGVQSGNPLACAFGGAVTIRGMKLETSNADHIVAGQGGHVIVDGALIFGAAGGQGHMVACFGGNITVRGTHKVDTHYAYKIVGGGQYHMSAGDCGSIYFNTDGQPGLISVYLPSPPAFTAAFACAQNDGVINCQAVAFSGGASCRTYQVKNNAVISTYNGNPNYFPGNVAGIANTGGQYN